VQVSARALAASFAFHALKTRIGRKLSAADFMRSAKVNFEHKDSVKLRHRMRGLKPAKRLRETMISIE
jgi:hypothetical protein